MIKSLIINPGSTSTKIGIFEDETQVFDKTLRHSSEEIGQFPTIFSQMDFRKNIILEALKEAGEDLKSFDVIVGRGGLVKPIEGGTYEVTDVLAKDLEIGVQGQHASNLGGLLAREVSSEVEAARADGVKVPAYFVDPVAVDEMQPLAGYTGLPEIRRTAISHPLNQKAIARRYAKEHGTSYDQLNLIVVHLGGGVSVGAHEKGKIIDVFNALDGDGTFSPERTGRVPSGQLIRMCFESGLTEKEVMKKFVGGGGFNAYLGTNDMREVDRLADEEHNALAAEVRDAFIYCICKDVGAQAAVLKGKVDQILLTGGIAYDKYVTEHIKERVSFIAPVSVYPGEDELLALAQGAIRVMTGEEEAKVY